MIRTNTMLSRPIAWSLLMTCLVVFLGVQGAPAQGETIMKNGLKAIHFERSGGLFELGKPVAADVVFEPPSAVLRTQSGAPRPLTHAEIAMFERIDPARLREFAEARRTRPPSSVPDDYQFDVVFTLKDGSSFKLTFHGQSLGDLKSLPVLAELASWVVAEIDRIWAAR